MTCPLNTSTRLLSAIDHAERITVGLFLFLNSFFFLFGAFFVELELERLTGTFKGGIVVTISAIAMESSGVRTSDSDLFTVSS